jgi:hypothetical protein
MRGSVFILTKYQDTYKNNLASTKDIDEIFIELYHGPMFLNALQNAEDTMLSVTKDVVIHAEPRQHNNERNENGAIVGPPCRD